MQDVHPSPLPNGAALPRRQSPLSIDVGNEPFEARMQLLLSENPVVIFSRPSCCMCHVMKSLFLTVGAHPTVVELESTEEEAVVGANGGLPAVFIGGAQVGGLEGLMGLHVSGMLVPRLREVGAIWG